MPNSRSFVSGAYDHRIHLWTLPTDETPLACDKLAIKHSAVVQALLPVKDTGRKLLSAGADCTLNVFDMAAERVFRSVKTSNAVYHLHNLELPSCALLEVRQISVSLS